MAQVWTDLTHLVPSQLGKQQVPTTRIKVTLFWNAFLVLNDVSLLERAFVWIWSNQIWYISPLLTECFHCSSAVQCISFAHLTCISPLKITIGIFPVPFEEWMSQMPKWKVQDFNDSFSKMSASFGMKSNVELIIFHAWYSFVTHCFYGN